MIVGGGIGGLTAALALQHFRIAVRVFEQSIELREIGAGVTVTPNAIAQTSVVALGLAVAHPRDVFTKAPRIFPLLFSFPQPNCITLCITYVCHGMIISNQPLMFTCRKTDHSEVLVSKMSLTLRLHSRFGSFLGISTRERIAGQMWPSDSVLTTAGHT